MVLQQASWDPLNCDLYSLVGLNADHMVWFVHRDFLRRQKLQNEITHKRQIWNTLYVANSLCVKDSAWAQTFRWFKRSQEGKENVDCNPYCGRPKTASSPEMVDTVSIYRPLNVTRNDSKWIKREQANRN
jgi:hypothetical protein